MRILVTNDDGIEAPGLAALVRAMKRLGTVTVAAPATVRSAVSHAITLYTPLMVRSRRKQWYAVEGTPADSVKIAVSQLMSKPPDMIVSGINKGLNTGSNIMYSGTVAGAMEGSLLGITSFAVSLQDAPGMNYERAARLASPIISKLFRTYRKGNVVFNLNFPAGPVRGVRVTRQESVPYLDRYERRVDPRGRVYYWLHGSPERKLVRDIRHNGAGPLHSDALSVHQGYVSVTPLKRDLTSYIVIDELENLFE